MALDDDFLDVYVPETDRVERIGRLAAETYDLQVVDDEGHPVPWSHLHPESSDATGEPDDDDESDDELEHDDEDNDLDDETSEPDGSAAE